MIDFVPGDIVEIPTKAGLAYVQISHKHPCYPTIVRAFPGLFPVRPDDLEALASEKSLFTAMIPIATAFSRIGVSVEPVARASIPAAEAVFPTFRTAIRDRGGNAVYWWLWDGNGLRIDGDIDETTATNLPKREVMSARRFVQNLLAKNAS